MTSRTAHNAQDGSRDSPRALFDELSDGMLPGAADLVEPDSLCAAVVAPSGATRWTEPEFLALIGDPAASSDCRALVERARRQRRACGPVATRRGAVVVEARTRAAAGDWPAPERVLGPLQENGGGVLLLAFMPSRSAKVVLTAARALGLTPREADIAVALLECATLADAADAVTMSVDTAKETVSRACRRVGVRGASELVGRLLDVACGFAHVDEVAAAQALGLTPAETPVAAAVARGEAVRRTARALGLSEATVKSHRRSIFAKAGVTRDRDLRRLMIEASRLVGLDQAQEVVLDAREAGERLRVVPRVDGRRIALFDYGPASGRPLLVLHGYNSWRRLPGGFVRRLQRDRWRPMVIQRPGFGLTDMSQGDFLDAAADDMVAVLVALGLGPAALLARGGAVAAAIRFAERRPDLFDRGVITNPQPTRDELPGAGEPLYQLAWRMLLQQPAMVAFMARHMRRNTRTANVRRVIQRMYRDIGDDQLPEDRPEILDALVQDAQALLARTTDGAAAEAMVFAKGWCVPERLPAGRWLLALSPEKWSKGESAAWARLSGVERRTVEGVVVLRAYTRPDEIADLLLF